MHGFYRDAQSIFETAQSGVENMEFALFVRPDGGLHMVMGSPVSLEGVTAHFGASQAFHVTRSSAGVRVAGSAYGMHCVLESATPAKQAAAFLRDSPRYLPAEAPPAALLSAN